MNAYDLTLPELAEHLHRWGEPSYRATQVYRQLWKRAATYDEMTDLPRTLRRRLERELPIGLRALAERSVDAGTTRKALLRLGSPGRIVETVAMAYPDRVTVCVSSQAGCAMGCGFCATGQMGLQGNLSAGEIAAQVVWANRAVTAGAAASGDRPAEEARPVTNVVFMGMGEPMANYRATRDAIARLLDPAGMDLAARHVTVSTVGVVPGIRRLAEDHPQVGLAVSFHAASDALRNELVPANRLWPLAELEAAVQAWRARTRRRPSIEWAMIDRRNDSAEQARLLAPIALRLHAHVNLIPLNPTPGWPTSPSPPGRIARFAEVLRRRGVPVTVRDTRGREIEAACGQLRWELEPAAIPSPA